MTSEGELVSIVIPCYNHAHYLGETIESALKQSYAPIEVIVVDDGSTDSSAEVAARYPVHLIQQPNQGVARAINAGVAAAKGTYVMAVGADDVLHSEYVKHLVGALESDPSITFAYPRILYFGAVSGEYPSAPFDRELLAERNYICAAALVRRFAFELADGLDPSIPRCEDWDFWLTLVERHMRGVYVPDALFYYRQHQTSYNSRRFLSLVGLRRELQMLARLQDRHPVLFEPRALRRRLATLPRRLLQREVSARFALLLLGFYGVMLARAAARRNLVRS